MKKIQNKDENLFVRFWPRGLAPWTQEFTNGPYVRQALEK